MPVTAAEISALRRSFILALDEHVGLADGIGLGVEFLPEHGEPRFGMQVELAEFLSDLIQQPGFGQPLNLDVEFEMLEDVAHRGRERLNVPGQITDTSDTSKSEYFDARNGLN
ncbi:MAG: hypothetical protein A2Z01_06125 [Betaproteobacteria bacterium RBG_16_58_11]|nr:MAG: hypothetical protein A2Z01_06125 [Betaproteobacteria bacterium RBG_16_58_11]OFZ98006.1 MAG: hypothetical protein A2Z44_08610 [Betaproteobacteria bacterium RBG_19FT_COMBO_58_11]